MRTTSIRVGIRVLFLAVGLCAVPTIVLADDAADIKKLEVQLQGVEKAIADPVAGHKEYKAANTKLAALLDQTNRLIKSDGDEDEGSPLHKLHHRLIKAKSSVAARLPTATDKANLRTGFPVPVYDEPKLLGELARDLEAAQAALAGHLTSSPKDTSGTQKLLHGLVLAQEKLAWEAGWPFTSKEAAAYKKAGGELTADVYHTRRRRGIGKINSQLASNAAEVGRDRPRQFVIHSPENKSHAAQISKSLVTSRGKAASSWSRGTRVFDGRERQALLSNR